MSDRAPSLEEMRKLARRATTGRWKADLNSQPTIWAGSMRVADIRGWGYLTGEGALALPHGEAVAVQEANARFLEAACPRNLIAHVDLLEELALDMEQAICLRHQGHPKDTCTACAAAETERQNGAAILDALAGKRRNDWCPLCREAADARESRGDG